MKAFTLFLALFMSANSFASFSCDLINDNLAGEYKNDYLNYRPSQNKATLSDKGSTIFIKKDGFNFLMVSKITILGQSKTIKMDVSLKQIEDGSCALLSEDEILAHFLYASKTGDRYILGHDDEDEMDILNRLN